MFNLPRKNCKILKTPRDLAEMFLGICTEERKVSLSERPPAECSRFYGISSAISSGASICVFCLSHVSHCTTKGNL